ncbi:MAG: GTPase HflX [Deltaproteobacteria bacterium]|nr:GTPase HflX [Deltaproteobacteria bacterium]
MKIEGRLTGLKPSQLRRLERLYRRRVPSADVVSLELAGELLEVSEELGRRVGVLLYRSGTVQLVVVGDATQLRLPDLGRERSGPVRFRGVRLVHTHLRPEPLTQDDLVQLTQHRLDLTAALWRTPHGPARTVELAYLRPPAPREKEPFVRIGPLPLERLELDLGRHLRELEAEFARAVRSRDVDRGRDRAILVHVARRADWNRGEGEISVAELRELARSAGVEVVDVLVQLRDRPDPRTILGEGRLQELNLRAMQLDVDLIIFDHDITPSQSRAIGDITDRRVLDRTQLILDIFAQHAETNDGKLQVELAQLKYMLPYLAKKDDALSRLTGGIGARGPGETKLEESRRRVREKVSRLEKQVRQLAQRRRQRRSLRSREGVPVVAIVGYTNVGKSTLLNTLTRSDVVAENKLFATLDPRSRRLRLPDGRDAVLTDTVGFIRRLPATLREAFRATLEELRDAALLVHLCDGSDPAVERQVRTVDELLGEMELADVPRILVVNKVDRLTAEETERLAEALGALPCSARDPASAAEIAREIVRRLPEPTVPEAGGDPELARWIRRGGGPAPTADEDG